MGLECITEGSRSGSERRASGVSIDGLGFQVQGCGYIV